MANPAWGIFLLLWKKIHITSCFLESIKHLSVMYHMGLQWKVVNREFTALLCVIVISDILLCNVLCTLQYYLPLIIIYYAVLCTVLWYVLGSIVYCTVSFTVQSYAVISIMYYSVFYTKQYHVMYNIFTV